MNKIRRNPWPLAIIVYFIVFIVGMFAWIAFAIRQDMDLVQRNYYEAELQFQRQLDRLNRSASLEGDVRVTFDLRQQTIAVQLPPSHAPNAKGRIHFYRPSAAKLDREFKLALNGNGSQSIDASDLAPGLWKIRIQWMAHGQEYYFEQSLVTSEN